VQHLSISTIGRRFGRVLATVVVGALLLGAGAGKLHDHEDSAAHAPCVFCSIAHQSAVVGKALALPGIQAAVEAVVVSDGGLAGREFAAPVAARGPPLFVTPTA
jgi:hypothetical protein